MSKRSRNKKRVRLKPGTRVRARTSVSTKPLPWNGDHGTGTQAATAGTILQPVEGSPNRMAARVRLDRVRELLPVLTMRQHQAAQEIQNAYACNEMLSSGAPLKEQVDSTSRPDAAIAAQVDAQSRLKRCTGPLLRCERELVRDVCWHNDPMRVIGQKHTRWLGRFRVAMDRVADGLGY